MCVCRLTENEHKKRQKVQKEKDEIGERIRPKINGKKRKIMENRHPWLQLYSQQQMLHNFRYKSDFSEPGISNTNQTCLSLKLQNRSSKNLCCTLLNKFHKEFCETIFVKQTTVNQDNTCFRCVHCLALKHLNVKTWSLNEREKNTLGLVLLDDFEM